MKRLALAILLGTVSTAGAAQPISVRPLSIKVIDSETKRPLSGITAHYRLTTVRPRYFLVFRAIDNPIYDDLGRRTAVTNGEGIVTFERRDYPRRRGEEPVWEEVMVNIGPVPPVGRIDYVTVESVPYRYLNGDYCGAVVFPITYKAGQPNVVTDRHDIRYTLMIIDESFAKEAESVTVELSRNPNTLPPRSSSG